MSPRNHVHASWLWVAIAVFILAAGALGFTRGFGDAFFFGCLIMARLHLLQARVEQIAEALDGKAISTGKFVLITSEPAHQDTHDFYNDADA